MNHFLNDSAIVSLLTILRATSTKWFPRLSKTLVLHSDNEEKSLQTQGSHKIICIKSCWEIIRNSRLPTPFLLVHSIGNSSLLWSLFKILFLSMSFSDLLLVSFDWQKSSRGHWKLILERIEFLSLRVLQSVSRQRLCIKRPVDTCACSWSFCGRFTTLGLFEVFKLRPFEERDMERQL